ncbi:50S ribosomal protein L21 [Aureibaculum marinum]|uniref:Large ribosomal subunit protein bL21 n=1 Tax=Aureibaculum marinum TaxID=2487930 RepID=A0A3N4NZS7_9FLAO|nr:50S ribosomal protein L21 [Aureibaculum marinum]RPD97780.1 50S ribosomal protein L21 [Aureibaculum marinum]
MYAIVEIAGQQFKVAKNQKVFVHRLQDKEGSKVTFDNVLLLDDGKVTVGAPAIEGAAVTAKILKHLKGDKVIVFKKKRRKGYKVKNGHRQYLSEIQIESIVGSGAKKAKKEEPKKETSKKAEPKAAAKVATADDLKKIEGIGPKIADIFVEAGIDTFAKLAKASQEELKAILEGAGSRYASKNPGSWPKQAKMAAEGKWDELKKWQDETKGGIE